MVFREVLSVDKLGDYDLELGEQSINRVFSVTLPRCNKISQLATRTATGKIPKIQ